MIRINKIVLIILFLVNALCGMEERFFSPQEIVFRLVTTYYLGHKEVCIFGSTSKDNDNLMKSLAETRKNLLSAISVNGIDDASAFSSIAWQMKEWHKYGSAHCSIAYEAPSKRTVEAFYCKLHWSFGAIAYHGMYEARQNNENFSPLICKPLMYRQGKEWYFYGIRTRKYVFDDRIDGIGYPHKVCRFEFGGPGLPCLLSVANLLSPKSTFIMDLVELLDYPVLVRTILDSTMVSKKKEIYKDMHGVTKKRYYLGYFLEGVTLPDDYKKYEKYQQPLLTIDPWNFRDKYLGEAIDQHYAQQKNRAAK